MSATPNEKGIHQWLDAEQFPEPLKKYVSFYDFVVG
jgi:hypothetical protein